MRPPVVKVSISKRKMGCASLVRAVVVLLLLGIHAVSCNSSIPSPSALALLSNETLIVDRSEFPASFKFGALTWAMKHESACYEDGKTDGLWDYFARLKGTIFDGTTPAAGADHYHRYREDIALLADLGMDSFRFSIAWPRMFPNGTMGEVNALAVDHYNNVINELIDAGIEPHVTLYEQDLPQDLEDSYGGLLSPLFIDDFVRFANACFYAFGDRVKHWMTFDEGNDFIPWAYAGIFAPPGRCTVGSYSFCSAGNSSTEPYIAGHNMLLAHAAAVELYRKNYKPSQQGEIGMAVWFRWFEPLSNSTEDMEASQRATDFTVGWFVEPVLYGDYPSSMKKMVGSRLPSFTEEESARIRGSVDFIGLNAVTTIYATVDESLNGSSASYFDDWGVTLTAYRDGVVIGRNDGDYFVPWGLEKVVSYMRIRYDNVPTYVACLGYGLQSVSLDDDVRVEFYAEYLKSLLVGMREGADVRGVFAWSLMDGFEASMGKQARFGLYYVDDSNVRYPRLSALWFKNMLTANMSLVYQS